MKTITLNIRKKEREEFTGWIITCKEEHGLFLFGPNLSEQLAKVPVALELLESARNGE